MMLTLLLISYAISSILQGCYGQTIINVADGVYSTKAESEGLHLSYTSIFKPIDALTIQLHLTSLYSVFVNYQITVGSSASFWTKLQVKHDDSGLTNAGSLVHYGNQAYKTATGYWMDNLKSGYYTFEVHYKSSSSISVATGSEYQTAILQVMWFSTANAVSEGVKCYPSPYPLNRYNVLSPIKDLTVTLPAYSSRVVLAAYQLAIYSASDLWFMVRMNQNNQQLKSTTMTQGYEYYYNMNSLWMEYLPFAEYEFGLTYRNAYSSYFEDCQNNYQGNKNLYAMYLPSSCSVMVTFRPTSSFLISSSWKNTDLSYIFTLYQTEHIIVRYQFSSRGYNTFLITRLSIDTIRQQTAAINGNTYYTGNSGMWQGPLSSGRHNITVQIRSGTSFWHYPSNDLSTRAMDIIRCN